MYVKKIQCIFLWAVALFFVIGNGFRMTASTIEPFRKTITVKMEYIPDGLTKEQWEAIKQKETEEAKAKGNLGVLGTNRFRSRSFEAWQKAGAKHLFPTDPNKTPYEERPYMQRRGGDWEGKDLEKVGLEGRGQGQASKRLKVDEYYEGQAKEGKLNSVSIFGGLPLPWTSEQAKKLNNQGNDTGATKAVAGKKLSKEEQERLKATLFKPIKKQQEQPKQTEKSKKDNDDTPKKKFLGIF